MNKQAHQPGDQRKVRVRPEHREAPELRRLARALIALVEKRAEEEAAKKGDVGKERR